MRESRGRRLRLRHEGPAAAASRRDLGEVAEAAARSATRPRELVYNTPVPRRRDATRRSATEPRTGRATATIEAPSPSVRSPSGAEARRLAIASCAVSSFSRRSTGGSFGDAGERDAPLDGREVGDQVPLGAGRRRAADCSDGAGFAACDAPEQPVTSQFQYVAQDVVDREGGAWGRRSVGGRSAGPRRRSRRASRPSRSTCRRRR